MQAAVWADEIVTRPAPPPTTYDSKGAGVNPSPTITRIDSPTREIDVRIARCARRAQILSFIMRQGLRAGLFGVILGFVAVSYAQRWYAGMLYQIAAFDPATVGVSERPNAATTERLKTGHGR